ncbi:MAG: hypothetical protein QW331_03920 [Candidatus Woesearchaeota archaeon]
MKKRGRRGQATLFIILGIMMLILVSVGIYYYRSTLIFTPEIVVPQQVQPIQRLVESCLYKKANEVVYLAGQQSGYVEIPEDIANNRNRGLELIPGSKFIVPYWHAGGVLRIPSKETITNNMERAIEKRIEECINFAPFANEFNFIERGEKKVKVIMNENNVAVLLNFPLEVQDKQGRKITDLEMFQVKVDKKFLRAYELAKEIMEEENENTFLEETTVDLLALDPEVPLSDLRFECKKLSWNKNNIKDEFRETIRENMRLMRVKNTKYPSFIEPERTYRQYDVLDVDPTGENLERLQIPANIPQDIYEYKHYFIDATPKDYSDLSVAFRYDTTWPMEMEVRPSSGNVLRSNTGKGAIRYFHLLCLNYFKFTYDVVYPIMVVIHDDDTDFTFRFAFPVQIKSNSPQRENFGFEQFEAPQYVKDFCEDTEQRTITITAVDKYLQQERNKVSISFECGNFYCPLGNTSHYRGKYFLSASLPKGCKPGRVIAERSDYLQGSKDLSGETNIKIDMVALRNLDVNFILEESTTKIRKEPERNQRIYLYMNEPELQHEVSLIYPDEGNTIRLVEADANYNVEIVLTEGDILKGGMFGNLEYERTDLADNKKVEFVVLQKIPEPISVEAQGRLLQELKENIYNLPKPELE